MQAPSEPPRYVPRALRSQNNPPPRHEETALYKIGHPLAWGMFSTLFTIWHTRNPFAGFIYGTMTGVGHLPSYPLKKAVDETFQNYHISQLYLVASGALSGVISYQAMKHLYRLTGRSVFHIHPNIAFAAVAGCEFTNVLSNYLMKKR